MQSIHVPASTVQRIARVLTWLPSSVVLGAIAAGYHWILNRASIDDVGAAVGPAKTAAAAAQADAHHAASLADEHTRQLAAAWARVVEQHADIQVLREYSRDPSRGAYFDRCRAYYAERYAAALQRTPTDPATAYAAAILTPWRPDK